VEYAGLYQKEKRRFRPLTTHAASTRAEGPICSERFSPQRDAFSLARALDTEFDEIGGDVLTFSP
jgi:hypothetical protein